ncbi:Aste57867_11079 [Aphanomyces stellatus]|uniref:ATP-dependent DNA helicase n=1 Tax=Aphanomyces stellatus TaxID=120398 RepID=A0A485KTU5_9STRA|nr:hypothetical protein As57867_011037 [Aphanomyces stellatus]VFT87946.1 Aste57867_11079 [Aphanomyces stellatus]
MEDIRRVAWHEARNLFSRGKQAKREIAEVVDLTADESHEAATDRPWGSAVRSHTGDNPSRAKLQRAKETMLPSQAIPFEMQWTGPVVWNGYDTALLMSTLRGQFGKETFRPGQEDVVLAAGRGEDVFVLMPTGAGKSLCYQLPACLDPGLTVVISPLLSLIEDQVAHLQALGIRVKMLSGGVSRAEQNEVYSNMLAKEVTIKLLYITPEKLAACKTLKQTLKHMIRRNTLARFVVDEAHCISQWGHDFRKDYMELGQLRANYPKVPIMALTATASNNTVQHIADSLKLKTPYIQTASFNRSNLSYAFRLKTTTFLQDLRDFVVARKDETGIIYCLSKKDCEKLVDEITQGDKSQHWVAFYHAELDGDEKTYRHQAWSEGTIKLIVATMAFGMGINKPDVRYVIHHSLPQSITHFYQESGRAGRDGLPSTCLVYYSYKDYSRRKKLLASGSSRQVHMKNLRQVMELCENTKSCRRQLLLEHFGQAWTPDLCKRTCDTCHGQLLEEMDITDDCHALWEIVKYCTQMGVCPTIIQVAHLYLGKKIPGKQASMQPFKIPGFGNGKKKSYSRAHVEGLLYFNVFHQYLTEMSKACGKYTTYFLRLGHSHISYVEGTRILLHTSSSLDDDYEE